MRIIIYLDYKPKCLYLIHLSQSKTTPIFADITFTIFKFELSNFDNFCDLYLMHCISPIEYPIELRYLIFLQEGIDLFTLLAFNMLCYQFIHRGICLCSQISQIHTHTHKQKHAGISLLKYLATYTRLDNEFVMWNLVFVLKIMFINYDTKFLNSI